MKKVLIFILMLFINLNHVFALEVNYKELYIGPGKQITLKAFNGESNNIVWKSSNPDIATVNNGVVSAKSLGVAYISISDGTYTITSKVYVIEDYIPIYSLDLDSNEVTLSIGSTKKIPVTINPSVASNKTLQYRSNNPNVASVTLDGNITANSEGVAYISITGESVSTSYKVNVVNKISLNSIEIPSKIELVEGETKKINVTYKPSNATNKSVSWKSSNTEIVTVDNNGNIKAISSGNATVTATSSDGNHKSIATITVNAIDKTLKGISLNKEKLTLELGKEETLTVIYNPNNADNKKVKWESSNNRIVSVEDGHIKAIKAGVAIITVTSADEQHEAKCEVTVPSPPVEEVKFTTTKKTVYVGSKDTLNLVIEPVGAIVENAIWTSSDEKIVTVTDGKIEALKIGTALVTVKDEKNKKEASIEINVIQKPPEALKITIKGYDLNFDQDQKNYTLSIGDEDSLDITSNMSSSKMTISGNKNLKNGSIITITINDKTKTTYVITIKKKQNYTIYFIGIITILLIINLIRIAISNKKKNKNQL